MPSEDTKFFIWARGRWRELCLSSGRVEGMGAVPVRFLYVKGKKLVSGNGPKVLRGLRSLAENKPSTVHDGPPLLQSRRSKQRACRPKQHTCRSSSRLRRRPCYCAARSNRCNHKLKEEKQNVQPTTAPTPRAHVGVQASEPYQNKTNNYSPVKSLRSPVKKTQTEAEEVAQLVRTKRKRSPSPVLEQSAKKRVLLVSRSGDRQLLQQRCKEVLINEDDADLYRKYLLKSDPNFDVHRFDNDDRFKIKLFYRINPTVSIIYCTRLEKMLLERRMSQNKISLKDFATKLGLRSISEPESDTKRYKMRRRTAVQTIASSATDDGTDKENVGRNTRTTLNKMFMVEAVQRNNNVSVAQDDGSVVSNNKRASDKRDGIEVKNSTDSSSDFQPKKTIFFKKKPVRKQHVKKLSSRPIRPSRASNRLAAGREYSAAEDHAIVAFVSGGDRAHLVNGNRMWRDLQERYARLTGQDRSWHSLRNRYLRHILPALGRLALPAPHAARLRAAAAKGEIKRRKSSKPNPLCVIPRVHSAWAARRPARIPTSSTSPAPSSPSPSSPSPSSPSPSAPTPNQVERVLRTRKKNNNTSVIENSPSPPHRSLRSSTVLPPLPGPSRPRSLPFSSQPSLPRAHVRPRMRKLYNPNNPTQ